MTGRPHRILPWILLASMLGLLAVGLYLATINDSFQVWLVVAALMVVGYGTVGALLASRARGGPLGWLMMAIGLGSTIGGFTSELLTYAYVTEPDASVPLLGFATWLFNWIWFVGLIPIPLILLLFPTGTIRSPRWRPVAWSIVGFGVLGAVAVTLGPEPVTTGTVTIENPTGVDALRDVAPIATAVVGVGLLATSLVSVVSLVLRFRGSRGDERQQIRWLAAMALVACLLLAGAIASTIGASGQDTVWSGALLLGFFVCIGMAFPAAIGVAVFKHRLYELDLVVKKTVLYVSVALLLVLLYLAAAAILGGALIQAPPGAILASILIGLAIWPAARLSRRFADRIVYGGRATPYEVLTDFSQRVGGAYAAEDVLPRMARIVADAVGAADAVVWLRVGAELRPVGRSSLHGHSPPSVTVTGDLPPRLPGDATVDIRDRGELLGMITVTAAPNDPMNPGKERLVRDLASQAGLVLRNVRLIEELRASRQRLVAAQDLERRRLERNIHDGAQQQLVALQVKLRLAEGLVERDPASARRLLEELGTQTTETLEDLRDLARGIYPPLLAEEGLPAALEAQVRRSPIPVTVEPEGLGRYAADIESAVFFSCLEALNNVAKYAEASTVSIHLAQEDGVLRFAVTDDGRGFDPGTTSHGTGLQGITDRLEAIGGSFHVESAPARGTIVSGSVPVEGRSGG